MQHASTTPSASSSKETCVLLIAVLRYSPARTLTRQMPQPPRRHPTGKRLGMFRNLPIPWARSSATSTRSSQYPAPAPYPSSDMEIRSGDSAFTKGARLADVPSPEESFGTIRLQPGKKSLMRPSAPFEEPARQSGALSESPNRLVRQPGSIVGKHPFRGPHRQLPRRQACHL